MKSNVAYILTIIGLILAFKMPLKAEIKPSQPIKHIKVVSDRIALKKAVIASKIVQVVNKPIVTPVSVAPTVAKPTLYTAGCSTYTSTFEQYSWNVNTAMAICEAESHGNINALSPTGDRGLMQVNYIHADMVDGDLGALYNPYTNIAVAYRIYESSGWFAWSTFKDGAYAQFLN